jgi:hypothetical protein
MSRIRCGNRLTVLKSGVLRNIGATETLAVDMNACGSNRYVSLITHIHGRKMAASIVPSDEEFSD